MKIRSEQLQALQETEARRKTQAPAEGFEALLAKQISTEQPQGSASAADMSSVLMPGTLPAALSGTLDSTAGTGINATPGEATERMETMFANFEQYADQLAKNDKANLREAYSLLENMTGQIADFRAAYPNMEAEQPELAAMVNELDVLATTETFKFNRGDYL